jgi:hypothetical protein
MVWHSVYKPYSSVPIYRCPCCGNRTLIREATTRFARFASGRTTDRMTTTQTW